MADMIICNLETLLERRGWTVYKLAQETGLHNSVLSKYRYGQVRRADLTAVEAICKALECGVGDLLEYVPDRKAKKR